MILPDTNIWLALTLSGHTHHQAAKAWLDGQPLSHSLIFCRATQQSFLRLMTTSSILCVYGIEPLTNKRAWEIYDELLADDRMCFHAEPPGVESVWKKLAARGTSSPKLWMDAYLAAFAIAAGAELVTTDKAFRQFPGLDSILIVP